MANEIQLNIQSFSFQKGGAAFVRSLGNVLINADGNDYSAGTQAVGTAQESLPLGEVANVGMVYLKNLDATNYVEYGCITGQLSGKLKPGEFNIFRAAANAVYVKANTAACDVEFCICSD